MRRVSFARARGTSIIEAESTAGASMPMTLIAGPVHNLDVRVPVPSRCHAVQHPRVGTELLLGEIQRVRRTSRQTVDRNVADLVVQSRDQPGQGREGVRYRASVQTVVDGVIERRHLDCDADAAPQRRREGGNSDPPVHGVRQDDDVGGQPLTVAVEEGRQGRRPRLLLALDDHGDSDAQVVAEHPQHGQMERDPGLVVGCATSVEPSVSLLRLERVGVPGGSVALGLDVVVGIEQDGGCAWWSRPVGDDGGLAACDRHHLDVGQAGIAEQPGDEIGALTDLVGGRRVRRDRPDPDQPLEIAADRRQDPSQGRAQCGGVVAAHLAYIRTSEANRSAIRISSTRSGWRTMIIPSEINVARQSRRCAPTGSSSSAAIASPCSVSRWSNPSMRSM